MPNLEPVLVQQDQIRIRHIGPAAAVWPGAPINLAQHALLNRTDLVARPLPISDEPASHDFVSGSWTGRLGDAGELQLVFPNATASDGLPWRQRFDPTGHLQFLEIYFNDELDAVGVIDQSTPSQPSVTVHADDGWWLLKKAYVRDWMVTQAPRDVIDRGTRLWTPCTVDNFPAGSLNSQWTQSTSGGGTINVGSAGGLYLMIPSDAASATVISPGPALTATSVWNSTCNVQTSSLGSGASFTLLVAESSGDQYFAQIYDGIAYFGAPGATMSIQPSSAVNYGLQVESDGEWVSGYINGQLIGTVRRNNVSTTSLQTNLELVGSSTSTAVINGVLAETLQPFLMRGTDKGDYVLPGDPSTYPSGGLSARYFNDADLVQDGNYLQKVMAPCRTQAFGGSSPAEYADQQDGVIYGQSNPAGASSTNWSCRWFGAIYLKLSQGTYTFNLNVPAGCAGRIWIGKTQYGQSSDSWSFSNGNVSIPVTVTPASLAGTLPYGAGTVARDGWYPIKVEYVVGSTAATAPALMLTDSPANYTDPGGTGIGAGPQDNPVPSSSLSPLGMIDQRYQGIAHFDLVQQTLQAVGLQAAVEPKQLESGLFPGVLAPRIREGHDTDIILAADDDERTDGEGILNFSSTLDSTDFASSIQGNGAGLQNGSTGQLQAMVYDPPTMRDSLFDAQQWQDNSDASLPALLQALLNSQLALSLTPWQSLSADPTSRPRRTLTWPLPGAIQNMRWRPGDGLFIRERSINVYDTIPRQMLVVTRNIGPEGIQSTNATFANRPKNPGRALKRQLFSATRQQRNYQRQLVSLTGTFVNDATVAGYNTATPASIVSLNPGDTIVDAVVRVAYNLTTTNAQSTQTFGLAVNSTPEALNGPWVTAPVVIPIQAVAAPDPTNRIYVWLTAGGSATQILAFQLLLTVLR